MKTFKLIAGIFMGILSLTTVCGQNQPVHPSKSYRIVIEKMDSTTERGILEEIKDSSVVISLKSGKDFSSKEINYSDIKLIKLRRTGTIARGSLIGFGSGTLIGGLMGTALYHPQKQDDPYAALLFSDDFGKNLSIAAGIIVGGIAGSLIGVGVGSANSIFVINRNDKNFRIQKTEMIKLVAD